MCLSLHTTFGVRSQTQPEVYTRGFIKTLLAQNNEPMPINYPRCTPASIYPNCAEANRATLAKDKAESRLDNGGCRCFRETRLGPFFDMYMFIAQAVLTKVKRKSGFQTVSYRLTFAYLSNTTTIVTVEGPQTLWGA